MNSEACEHCGESFSDSEFRLRKIIHHIDGNHFNDISENLMAIHRGCHSKIHHKGKIISKEQREKVSEANKGNKYRKGHKFSEKSKKKMSESHKGKIASEDTKLKMSKSKQRENHLMFGRHHTDETKKKIGDAHRRKIVSDETKKQISESLILTNLIKRTLK